VTGVVVWLEQRRKDLMILTSRIRIPLWDVSAGHADETVYTDITRLSRCGM
jgi:hypothetical protein